MAAEAVSTITIRGNSSGLDKLAADVRAVDAAQKGVIVTSDQVEKKTLSVENAIKRLQRSYDAAFRAQEDFARSARTINQAYSQNLISEQRRGQLLALA